MQKGEKMSDETKMLISLSKKGIPLPKMVGNKNGHGNKGRIFTENTLFRMSIAKKGKKSSRKNYIVSPETRIKISNSKKGRKQSFEERDKNRQSQIKMFYEKIPNYIPYVSLELRKKRIKESGTYHSRGEWDLLKIQYNLTCPSCNRKEPDIKLTQDHIIPISKGGSDWIENIQPLCHSCNCKKHTKTIRY